MALDQPLFEDNSAAGYDWAAHAAVYLIADARGMDPTDPEDALIIRQILSTYLDKLDMRANSQLRDRPRTPPRHGSY